MSLLVATLLLVPNSACRRTPPRAGPPAEIVGDGRDVFSNEARLAAMLSIHAYAAWPHEHFPPDVAVQTLEEAVDFLDRDTDALAVSRRRRAIGKLAAHGLDRPRFQDALRTLGALPDEIADAIAARTRIRRLSAAELETFVYDLHAHLSAPGCKWRGLYEIPTLPDAPQTTKAVTIWVELPLDRVAPNFDPQRWDECSKFFSPPERTYLATLDPNGKPVPAPSEPAGSAYGTPNPLLLFERFTCQTSGCSAWYDTPQANQATLRCGGLPGAGTSRYNLSYGLNTASGGAVNNVQNKVTTDQGEGCAQADPAGGTKAYASKTVAFDNLAANGISQALLGFAELAGELAELLCCGMPAQPADHLQAAPMLAGGAPGF